MKKTWIGLSLFLSVVALAEFAWFQVDARHQPAHSQFASMTASWVKAPHPVPLPAFQLVANHDRPFRRQDLLGRWHLLVFGYTSCPDVCPTTLSILSRTVKNMRQQGLMPIPQVIFISVDPDRDTPAHLADYVTYFNKDFIALTGTPAELKGLLHALGSDYQIDRHEGRVTVNHPTSLFLIDPQGELTGLFSHPTLPSRLGAEIKVALQSDRDAETHAP
jgi:protein SCO1/2